MKKRSFKGVVHTVLKILLILFAVMIVLNVVILVGVNVSHKKKLKKEMPYLQKTGQYVEYEGHKIHADVGGNDNSKYTLVFLHSNGIVDDSIALQPLLAKLSDYRYVYIDRSGYGFSDVGNGSKDLDSMLKEMRDVLAKLEVEGPYVLVPSGVAGLLASYWAKTCPQEVAGIIGFNMDLPEEFDGITEEQYCGFFNYLMSKFAKIGGHRLVSSIYPDNIRAVYTEKQMLTRKALISRGYYNDDLYQEDLNTIANAKKAKEAGVPTDIPILAFVANPLMQPYFDDDESIRREYEEAIDEVYGTQTDAAKEVDYVGRFNEEKKAVYGKYSNIECVEMSGPSRLYTYAVQEVADVIHEFMGKVDK